MMMNKRRVFLQQGTMATASAVMAPAALLPRSAHSAPTQAARTPAFAVDASGLATAQGLQQLVQAMVDIGPRLTGNAAHKAYVDQLATTFSELGLQVSRDTQVFDRWEVGNHSLKVARGGQMVPVTVAGYHPYSGSTPPEGITGRLVYLGTKAPTLPDPRSLDSFDTLVGQMTQQMTASATSSASSVPGGLKGAIVLVDLPNLPLVAGLFDLAKVYEYDPHDTIHFSTPYRRQWINGFLAAIADLYKSLGAAGVVYIMDASPEDAKGQYVPFFSKLKQFPGLLVDRDVGAQLKWSALARANACLTLTATIERQATSDSLVAILPGMSSENVVINTHTDGQNAFEENGTSACIALARYYAAKPIAQRPRTLVFSCVTGHMVAGLPQAQGFVDAHPDLIAQSVASMTIEHLGAKEWSDSPIYGYRPTGLPEVAAIFCTSTGLRAPAITAIEAVDLQRTLMSKPVFGFFFGVGVPLYKAGVPTLAYITGPEYLVAIAPNGHMDKFDAQRMRRELMWCVGVLAQLDGMTAQAIRS